MRPVRSKLFVPGSRPELFAKALASKADALSFDLEDAVPEGSKQAAREAVAEFVGRDDALHSGKIVIVRTNAVDTDWFEQDTAWIARTGVTLLNLPKVETPESVQAAVAIIAAAEQHNGVSTPIGLLLNIETPRGLANAAAIAAAHPRVAGLQLGLGDLFEPNGIQRYDRQNVHAVMFEVRMAAARAGVFALDGAYPALDDEDGYTAEARVARGLGFLGKTCVHPRQVPWANAVFSPTEAELAAARRVVEAARAQQGSAACGAFVVDGRMVDVPFLKRAEALLAAARRQ